MSILNSNIHDVIKINYTRQGYLPYYPYHMIADDEMFEGFLAYQTSSESVASGTKVDDGVQYALLNIPDKCVISTSVIYNGDTYSDCKFDQEKKIIIIPNQTDSSLSIEITYTILKDSTYFNDTYPCEYSKFYSIYAKLVNAMQYHINIYLNMINDALDHPVTYYTNGVDNLIASEYNKLSKSDKLKYTTGYVLPDWIYTYMLGEVTGPNSDEMDIHDLLSFINLDNDEGTFTENVYQTLYDLSSSWLSKLTTLDMTHRPATIFGEPHVWKSLRLMQEGPQYNPDKS